MREESYLSPHIFHVDIFSVNAKFTNNIKLFSTFGNVFAVIYKNDENQECLYFGKLFIKERNYPTPHIQPVLYLTRCVGSNISKKHFSKVSDYILSHYKEISELELGNVIEAKL